MKILFIDTDKELETLVRHISSMGLFEISFCHHYDCGLETFHSQKFDIVIINFSFNFGSKVLNTILKENPQQRIITLSEDLACSELRGGDYCQKNYNKKRLLKPVNTSDLVSIIKDFDNWECQFKNKFNTPCGLIDIMDKIAHQYNLSYDSKNKIIPFKHMDSNTLNFISILKEKEIKFDIDENYIKLEKVK